MKVGDTYFRALVDEGKVIIDEYVLRTMRGGYGYLIDKSPITWGKRSKKHGDFGWLDPIPTWLRTRFKIENGVPSGFGKSKSAAIRSALADRRKRRDGWKDDPEYLAEIDQDIAVLQKRLSRAS